MAAAVAFGAGCARVPVAASGAEARDRLLDARAGAPAPTRGVGTIAAKIGGRGGSFEARWGSSGDSLVVVGYSGPVRALDASVLGDSIFVGIRPRELGVTGLVRGDEGLGADGIRFLLEPWDFSPSWIRAVLERSATVSNEGGWVLQGTGEAAERRVNLSLEITDRGEPRKLVLFWQNEPLSAIIVRYGPTRRYAAGRFPRWVEWTRGTWKRVGEGWEVDARVRLDVRDVDPLPGGVLRRLPPAPAEWRVVSVDDPEGRKILGRLLGSKQEAPR